MRFIQPLCSLILHLRFLLPSGKIFPVTQTTPPHPSYFQSIVLASRPKTLPAAASPVIVGWGIALGMHHFALLPAMVTLLCAVLIQIGTNMVNDVLDFQKGADTSERLGPVRVTLSGLLTPQQVWLATLATFGLAALGGVYLAFYAGWPVIVIGLACMLAGYLYTGGPLPLTHIGLGDLFVLLFFGFTALCGTVFVLTGSIPPIAWLSAFGVGVLVTDILVVNNIRDINTDRQAGRINIPSQYGRCAGEIEYGVLVIFAYITPPLMILLTGENPAVLLALLSLPLAIRLFLRLKATPIGREFNTLLAGTARLLLVYSLLLAVGVAI
jgi:1,4-dihydroxy-2-naphthoate octaprenyltransferase